MKTLIRTSILVMMLGLPPAMMVTEARADDAAQLKTALASVARQRWPEALLTAPAGIGQDIIMWERLRAGEGDLGEYESFLQRHPDWPGLSLLREKGEAAVARSETPARIIAYFGNDRPQTADGALTLVRALLAVNNRTRAETEAMQAWAELNFDPGQEARLKALLPEAVRAADGLRLENLLWAGKASAAERMVSGLEGGQKALAKARIGLRVRQPGVDLLVKDVPANLLSDPGLMYERFIYRMGRDDYDGAAELILSVGSEALGRPEFWAPRRLLLARWLMRQGRADEAWRVAATHGLSGGTDFAELEFLAGFVALEKLGQPGRALDHFSRLKAAVSTPISLSRANYWLGRAEEAMERNDKAASYYQEAARHQTAYYGLLAAERLGLTLDPRLLDGSVPQGWRQSRFAGSSVLEAGRLLSRAGADSLSGRFFLHLSESLDGDETAQLAGMAIEMNRPHIALRLAKRAAAQGEIVPAAYFPLTDMVPDGLHVSRALALAIARQESEFDPKARSSANAFGLMQLLPGTAEAMAKELGLDYTTGRLTADPAFNVTLGSAYLAKMVDEFGPSIALIASGYNAGPGRPRRWIGEFGDPRTDDIVDWVETIPFAETRTYVMRVVEGVVIYRARLKGQAGPVRITTELKG